MAQRRLQPTADLSEGVALDWLTPTDAAFLAESIQRIARAEARRAIAEQLGAQRAYAWSIGNPNADPIPVPPLFVIELPCRPVDVLASCVTAPTAGLGVDIARSIDGGATFQTITDAQAVIAPGAHQGAGATFMWELPDTRELRPVGFFGAGLVAFLPGDLIQLVLAGGEGTASLSVQLRTERVGEHTRRGVR